MDHPKGVTADDYASRLADKLEHGEKLSPEIKARLQAALAAETSKTVIRIGGAKEASPAVLATQTAADAPRSGEETPLDGNPALVAAQKMWDAKWNDPNVREQLAKLTPQQKQTVDMLTADIIRHADTFLLPKTKPHGVVRDDFKGGQMDFTSIMVKKPTTAEMDRQGLVDQYRGKVMQVGTLEPDVSSITVLPMKDGRVGLYFHYMAGKGLYEPGRFNHQDFFITMPSNSETAKLFTAKEIDNPVPFALMQHVLRHAAAALSPEAAVYVDVGCNQKNVLVVNDPQQHRFTKLKNDPASVAVRHRTFPDVEAYNNSVKCELTEPWMADISSRGAYHISSQTTRRGDTDAAYVKTLVESVQPAHQAAQALGGKGVAG